jgi:hypothetical protein
MDGKAIPWVAWMDGEDIMCVTPSGLCSDVRDAIDHALIESSLLQVSHVKDICTTEKTQQWARVVVWLDEETHRLLPRPCAFGAVVALLPLNGEVRVYPVAVDLVTDVTILAYSSGSFSLRSGVESSLAELLSNLRGPARQNMVEWAYMWQRCPGDDLFKLWEDSKPVSNKYLEAGRAIYDEIVDGKCTRWDAVMCVSVAIDKLALPERGFDLRSRLYTPLRKERVKGGNDGV